MVVISSLCLILVAAIRRISELELRSTGISPADLNHIANYLDQNASVGTTSFFPVEVMYDPSGDAFFVDGFYYINNEKSERSYLPFNREKEEYVAVLFEQHLKKLDDSPDIFMRRTGKAKKRLVLPLSDTAKFKFSKGWNQYSFRITRNAPPPKQLPKSDGLKSVPFR